MPCQTHIFTFILYKDYNTPGKLIFHVKHTYLHLYFTRTIPQGSLYFMSNTHIYIYTLQGLQYPRETLQFFAYIPGIFWTIQHLSPRTCQSLCSRGRSSTMLTKSKNGRVGGFWSETCCGIRGGDVLMWKTERGRVYVQIARGEFLFPPQKASCSTNIVLRIRYHYSV